MRASWMTAALLGSILTVGCGGPQTTETTEDTPETAASAPEAPDAPASPRARTTPVPICPPRPASPAPARESDSRPGAATPAPARVEYRDLAVPANTPLTLELLTALSSETAQVETPVRARLKQAISVEGYPVLPVGTELTGAVTEVAQAGRVKGRARVTFVLTDAMVGGAREKLRTNPVTFEAEATKTEDATRTNRRLRSPVRPRPTPLRHLLHRCQEIAVRLRLPETIEQQLHGLHWRQWIQHLPQHPDPAQILARDHRGQWQNAAP